MKKKRIKRNFIAVILVLTAFFMGNCKVELDRKEEKKQEEKRGVFFSYMEITKHFQNVGEIDAKKRIQEIIDFTKEKNLNMILLQVRSFSDAIYKSKIYPMSKTLVQKEGEEYPFDFLEYFLKIAHEKGIEVHAWINPYRVRNNDDVSSISIKNPAFQYLGTSKVQVIENQGIYYNPASSEVKDLIIEGIKELIENYEVDGIHFDDYFYPNDTIDEEEYKEYQAVMTKEEFHIMQVNELVSRVYKTVKEKNLVFGISPEGNIENNYQRNYADIKTWLTEDGYIDYIMPQIYYGFLNQVKPFESTIEEWNRLIKNKVSLIPALALYKSGTTDQYAKSGMDEWINSSDIIKREISSARKISNYKGFSLFRFDFLYTETENKNLLSERENLFRLLKDPFQIKDEKR